MLLVLLHSRNVAKGLHQIELYYISKDVVVIFTQKNIFLHLKIGNLIFPREDGISHYFFKTHQLN